jgi:hypothetical protein
MAQSYTYKFDGLRWVWPDGHTSYDPPPAVEEQVRAYRRHYNDRIEIVRWSRQQYRETRSQLVPELAAAEAAHEQARRAVEEARLAIAAVRRDSRRRSEGPELRARLTEVVQARKLASSELKVARSRATTEPALLAASDEINKERTKREKQVRAGTAAYWGTYLLAEEASDAAARSRTDPEFKRSRSGLPTTVKPPCPEGKIGVQVQSTKPITVTGLFSCQDSRIRLEAPSGNPKRPKFSRGWIRIGSAGRSGREPVWAEFVVRVRRPMPPGARIKWAWVSRKREGLQWRNALCISLEREPPSEHPCRERTIALDLNMRIVADGIRVGYSFDGERVREWVLPQAIIDKIEHGRSIASIRDRARNEFIAEFSAWLKTAAVPDWMRDLTATIARWHSSSRLATLVIRWRGERFDDDREMFLRADAWRSQDRHLYDYSHGDAYRALCRRLDIYRGWAKEICDRYGTVIVAAWDWSEIAKRPKVGEESDVPEAVRAMRVRVAVHELVRALRYAERTRGGTLIEADPVPIACTACQAADISEDKENGSARCLKCSASLVRDELQARALYAARERLGGESPEGAARETDALEITRKEDSSLAQPGN